MYYFPYLIYSEYPNCPRYNIFTAKHEVKRVLYSYKMQEQFVKYFFIYSSKHQTLRGSKYVLLDSVL